MKYTAQRKVGEMPERIEGGDKIAPARAQFLALTLAMDDRDVRLMELREEDVRPALSRALGIVAHLLCPQESWIEKAIDELPFLHPKDCALYLSREGRLIRVAFESEAHLAALRELGYRYLSDAYDSQGRLLPAFWHCDLIDMRERPR